MFFANLVILAQIYDEVSRGQAKFPRILSQNGQNDLEGQSQWPPFSIPAESIPWCMFGGNMLIPAQICEDDQDTIRVAIGVSLRVKIQSDQNPIKYT